MKNYQLLLSSLLMLGTLNCIQHADAYEVSLKSSGGVNVGPNLEQYEQQVLDKIYQQVKDSKLAKESRLRVVVGGSGQLTEVTFLAPRPDKDVRDELANRILSIAMQPVPGVDGNVALTLEFDVRELDTLPYQRNGISISGGRGVRMSGGIISAPGRGVSVEPSQPPMEPAAALARQFDRQQRMMTSISRRRDALKDSRLNGALYEPVNSKISTCLEALQTVQMQELKSNLDGMANDIEALPYLNDGISISMNLNSLIMQIATQSFGSNFEPQLTKLGRSIERKTKLGIDGSFFEQAAKTKNSSVDQLAEKFYNIKLSRLKDAFELNADWLEELSSIAEERGKAADAIECQRKLIALVHDDPIAETNANLKLATLQISKGDNVAAKLACESALKIMTQEKLQNPADDSLSSNLAKVATAIAPVDVVLADKLARKAIESLLTQPQIVRHDFGVTSSRMRRNLSARDREIKDATSALLDQYTSKSDYSSGVGFLEFAVKRMSEVRGDDSQGVYDLRYRLADLTLDASSKDEKQKTKWLTQSDAAFDDLLKVEKAKGSKDYNRLIRTRVEKLDRLGYEEQAKSLEKLLEL